MNSSTYSERCLKKDYALVTVKTLKLAPGHRFSDIGPSHSC